MTTPFAEASVEVILDWGNIDDELVSRLDKSTKIAAQAVDKNFDSMQAGAKKATDAMAKGAEDSSRRQVAASGKSAQAAGKAAQSVDQAAQQVARARRAEEDAAGRVRAAESKLKDLRDRGISNAGQLAAAEEGVARAKRSHANATDNLSAALSKQKTAAEQAAAASKNAADATQNLAGRASDASGAMERGGRSADVTAGGLGRMAGMAAAAATAVFSVGTVLKSGFDRLMTLQKAEITFKNIGLSAGETTKVMSDLESVVTGTSVSMASASQTASMLMQSGVEAGKPLNDSIKAMANISAIAGGASEDVGMVLMQIKASGRLLGGDAMQLQGRGVNIYQYLADNLGKSMAEVKKMGEDGKISYEMVIDAVNAKTGDLAKEMGETLPAKMQNFKTSLASFGAGILEPFIPAATQAVEKFTQIFKTAKGPVSEFFSFLAEHDWILKSLAAVLTTAVIPALALYAKSQALAFGEKVMGGVGKIVGPWQKMAGAIKQSTIATKLGTVANKLFAASFYGIPIMWIIVAIAAVVAALWAFFTKTETGRKLWAKIWGGIKAAVAAVVDWFKNTAWPWMQQVFQKIGEIAMWLWNNIMKPVWNGIKAVIGVVWTIIKGYFTAWWTVIQILGKVVVWLWKNVMLPAWNGIKAVIGVVWNVIKVIFTVMMAVIKAVGAVVMWLWKFIIVPAFTAIKFVIQLWWAAVQIVFKIFMVVLKAVGSVLSWLWKNVAMPVFHGIGAVLSAVWNGVIKPVLDLFWRGIQKLGEVAMWLWENAMKPAWDAIKGAIDAVWNFVKPIFEKIGNAFNVMGDIAKQVGSTMKSAFDGVVNVLKAPIHAIGGLLAKIPTSILGVDIPGAGTLRSWGATLQSLRTGGVVAGGATTQVAPDAFIVNARQTARHRKLLAALVPSGRVISGPGSTTSDSIVGKWNGKPTSRVSRGEFYAPPKQAARALPLLWAINAGLPRFDAGGLTPHAQSVREYIFKQWPSIKDIGGYRPPDGYNEHSTGNALDVMIPDWGGDGKSTGDEVLAWAQKNAAALGYTHAIWQQKFFPKGNDAGTPMEDRGDPTQNHMDHVHLFMNDPPQGGISAVGGPTGSGVSNADAGNLGSSGVSGSTPIGSGLGSSGGGSSWGNSGGSSKYNTAADAQRGGVQPVWVENWPSMIGGGGDSSASLSTDSSTSSLSTADTGSTSGEDTIELKKNDDGTYAAVDPEWNKLIQRESGGRPDVVQGVQDVNSGGNEASGLFQIAKGTWAGYGGTKFAPTAGEATPEQQAEIAAKIFNKEGGSPWGSGAGQNFGRENEDALRAGIKKGGTAEVPLTADGNVPVEIEDSADLSVTPAEPQLDAADVSDQQETPTESPETGGTSEPTEITLPDMAGDPSAMGGNLVAWSIETLWQKFLAEHPELGKYGGAVAGVANTAVSGQIGAALDPFGLNVEPHWKAAAMQYMSDNRGTDGTIAHAIDQGFKKAINAGVGQTNITVNGDGKDPRAIAEEVVSAQDRNRKRAMRRYITT